MEKLCQNCQNKYKAGDDTLRCVFSHLIIEDGKEAPTICITKGYYIERDTKTPSLFDIE